MRLVAYAVLTVATVSAHAEGLYLGGGAYLRHYDLGQAGATDANTPSGYTLSGKLFGGYDFNDTWAFEGGYVGFGKPAYRYSVNGTASELKAGGNAWYGAIMASVPFSDQVSFFGKLGLDRHTFDVTGSGAATALVTHKTSTALYLGTGAQYKFSKQLASTLEIEHFGTEPSPGSSLIGVSLNLKYSF